MHWIFLLNMLLKLFLLCIQLCILVMKVSGCLRHFDDLRRDTIILPRPYHANDPMNIHRLKSLPPGHKTKFFRNIGENSSNDEIARNWILHVSITIVSGEWSPLGSRSTFSLLQQLVKWLTTSDIISLTKEHEPAVCQFFSWPAITNWRQKDHSSPYSTILEILVFFIMSSDGA